MKKTVLIVEDEALMCEVLRDYFEAEDFYVTVTDDGLKAVEIIDETSFDLILLDIMLPGLDGFSVCRHIRKKLLTPVIMITARSDEYDKLRGYEVGADDYVTKPFSPKVLLAKSKAVINRAKGISPGGSNEFISCSGIKIDINAHSVFVDGNEIELTPKEFDLLVLLMENKGRVLSRDTLLTHIWGYDYFGDVRAVDTHIKKLRAKLGNRSGHIKTLIRAGYRFDEKI